MPVLKGVTAYRNVLKFTDTCIGTAYLVEYYCNTKYSVPALKLMRCTSRCGAGACKAILLAKKKLSAKMKKRVKKLEKELSTKLDELQ